MRPIPTLVTGQVRIRVGEIGINRPDFLQPSGLYPVPAGASDISGLEVAGIATDGEAQSMAYAGLNIGEIRQSDEWKMARSALSLAASASTQQR